MPEQPESMTCHAALEELDAYIDGDLATGRAHSIETHLAGCSMCSEDHRLAVAIQSELRALPELDTPPEVLRSVFREVGVARFRRPAWRYLAAAALAAAVLGLSLWVGLRETVDPKTQVAEGPKAEVPVDPHQVDAEEVIRATAETRYALAYLARVSRKAGRTLRDDLLIERVARPTARGLARSLIPFAEENPEASGINESADVRDRS